MLVFTNVLARLRRTSTSLSEASADLGASGWQTFRDVVSLPLIAAAAHLMRDEGAGTRVVQGE
ncbi:MAG: hypothetical protein ACRDLS_00150 [Solirubrobacteraceae bacterium]